MISEYYWGLFKIYVVSFIILVSVGPFLQNPTIRKMSKFCFLRAPDGLWEIISPLRGFNYYLDEKERKDPQYRANCLVTTWALSHFILYLILGYYYPQMFWETFMIGIMFEIAENMAMDCHDVLDVLWNSLGFVVGRWLSPF